MDEDCTMGLAAAIKAAGSLLSWPEFMLMTNWRLGVQLMLKLYGQKDTKSAYKN